MKINLALLLRNGVSIRGLQYCNYFSAALISLIFQVLQDQGTRIHVLLLDSKMPCTYWVVINNR